MHSAVEREIRELFHKRGRITFAQYMQTCLYSPKGGFYSHRGERISAHFQTSATMHPVFGALIARQLEQMWNILGNPPVFHVIEVGSGDGVLAQSIVTACRRETPQFAEALYYVCADYTPGWSESADHSLNRRAGIAHPTSPSRPGATSGIQIVKTAGLKPFRNVAGCILSNELIDNFPVHRFRIQGGEIKEVYVTLVDGKITETLDEPSTPRIEKRIAALGLSLPEGYRGEVNLAMEDWVDQVSTSLSRGFVLTIDYGQPAAELYSPQNAQGTLVCHYRHGVNDDPYRNIGEQDITCQVDFTSLKLLGERQGLVTVGYSTQSRFLTNLGFHSFLEAQQPEGRSAARTEFSRIAMMTLLDPSEYGDFKVLAQARGIQPGADLLGFDGDGSVPSG